MELIFEFIILGGCFEVLTSEESVNLVERILRYLMSCHGLYCPQWTTQITCFS